MIDYEFILNDNIDITNRVLNFTYSENIDDFASSFSFEYLPEIQTDDLGITSRINNRNVLNKIQLRERGQTNFFYTGFITDSEHTTDVNKYIYSGFDVGFYLNKNEVIIQFRNANIGDAIQTLCNEHNINLESMPNFTQSVSKIYKDVIFSDIVKELLQFERDKGGRRDVFIDCKNGNLNILRYTLNNALGSVIANNIRVNSFDTISNVNIKHSIQDLKNRVIYSDNNEKSIRRVIRQDNNSIDTYGLLTDIETVDTKTTNNLGRLALTKLNELNKVSDTITLSMLGDFNVRKGIIIPLTINQYSLNGTYLIRKVTHTIDDKKEVVDLEIEERRT